MSRLEHVVVWDGSRRGPGGAYLFAEAVPTITPVVTAPARRATDNPVHARVTERLRGAAPMTVRELADALQVAPYNINSALYVLRAKGLVAIVGARPFAGRYFGNYGRKGEQLYALADGGAQ